MASLAVRFREPVEAISTQESLRDRLRTDICAQIVQNLDSLETANGEAVFRYIFSIIFSESSLEFYDLRDSLPTKSRSVVNDVYSGRDIYEITPTFDPNRYIHSAERVHRFAVCWWWARQGYLLQNQADIFVPSNVRNPSGAAIDCANILVGQRFASCRQLYPRSSV